MNKIEEKAKSIPVHCSALEWSLQCTGMAYEPMFIFVDILSTFFRNIQGIPSIAFVHWPV